jgi:hypothetical protein
MLTRLIAAAVLLVAVPGFAQEAGKPKETAEQKAVRAYLRENLPTGKFEEVKWWPVKQLLVNGGEKGPNAIRLKFRAANEQGGMSVYDDVFVFKKAGVERHSEGAAYNSNKERIFGK